MSQRAASALPVDSAMAAQAAASRGLFVGVTSFESRDFTPVPYAVDDAVDLAFLFAVELGLLLPEHCVLLLTGAPKKAASGDKLNHLLLNGARRFDARQADIYHHLSTQTSSCGAAGLCLVTFASHGVADGEGSYVLPKEAVKSWLRTTAVKAQDLFDAVASAPSARRMVLLDVCRERSSALLRASDADLPLDSSFVEAMKKASGQVVLGAAPLGGFAYDDPDQENGVFTAAVVRGLRGAAAADERGFITASTLAKYAEAEVIRHIERNSHLRRGRDLGITKHFEGPAETMPLAINVATQRRHDQERVKAALDKLKSAIGHVISGKDYEEIKAFLPPAGPFSAEVEKLLAGIERLDNDEMRQEGLLALWRRVAGADGKAVERSVKRKILLVPLSAIAVLVVGIWWMVARDGPTPPDAKQVAQPAANPKAGDLAIDALGGRYRYIPAGQFKIGSPPTEVGRDDDETVRSVAISQGFWLGETEVTQSLWQRIAGNNPSHFSTCGGDCPVEQVSFFDAVAFANLISKAANKSACYRLECQSAIGTEGFACTKIELVAGCAGYRLPTEEEWEVAARAMLDGQLLPFYQPSSKPNATLGDIAWFGENSGGKTHEVRGKLPNAWGLHDMLGNVWEWTSTPQGSHRVFRGGSWYGVAQDVRAAYRAHYSPSFRWSALGFRLARGQAALEPVQEERSDP